MAETTPRAESGEAGSRATALRRQLGLPGAVMVGLGSIVGTGVFVSLGLATIHAAGAVVVAVLLAALVATVNGLNSAQLAASHAVSGGTYEYGYRYLKPWLGFSAGWMFLCAKSASAATAALGFCGYLFHVVDFDAAGWLVPAALATLAVLTCLTLSGLKRSNRVNIAIVSFTLLTLLSFVVVGLLKYTDVTTVATDNANASPWHAMLAIGSGEGQTSWIALLQATALLFVAYTGYGRIATLGEEVHEPRRVIPRAMILTLVATAIIYGSVATALVLTISSVEFRNESFNLAAPLEVAAARLHTPWLIWLLAAGAATGMLSVMLNLLLGLSRVVLAMARRGDMPPILARLDQHGNSPYLAVLLMALIIGGLVLVGDVKTTWSFSALTVLIYYAITNLAALFLPNELRIYPRWIAMSGLLACLGLACFVEPIYWIAGAVIMAVGLVWHLIAQTIAAR